MNQDMQPDDTTLATGIQLLGREEADAYSFLGIQAERMEIAEDRIKRGRPVPEWSDADAYRKVLSDQRATIDDLKEYAAKGRAFVGEHLRKLEPELRELLCQGPQVRPEILELEADTKSLLKYMASTIIGVVVVNLPAGLIGAAASIATVLAVIIIKNKTEKFCKLGAEAIEQPT